MAVITFSTRLNMVNGFTGSDSTIMTTGAGGRHCIVTELCRRPCTAHVTIFAGIITRDMT